MEIFGNDITLFILIALMASAFAAGFIDSVAGGGGLILVPSFILAGLPPQLALGQEKNRQYTWYDCRHQKFCS